ncbi:MAG: FHA domain-containing protein [Pyrinomonadaceae bacterium]
MIRCQSCSKVNPDSFRFCDECGSKLVAQPFSETGPNGSGTDGAHEATPVSVPLPAQVTSMGLPPLEAAPVEFSGHGEQVEEQPVSGAHAKLIIERGDSANTEFPLTTEESYLGRWDADNGIFPDVDLDAYDPDAKVSRRHARISFRGKVHMIEDLGSTNGTFINRGRRLLPGSPQVLNEGDEIIVGKTFLRFRIIR